MDGYRISYSVISIPAGLSHRLKPARRAALAVEKVTAGRSFCKKPDRYRVLSLCILILSLRVINGPVHINCLPQRINELYKPNINMGIYLPDQNCITVKAKNFNSGSSFLII